MQTERTKPLLENFALLFYICKILGLNSQDWRHFRCYKQFKKSTTGECIVVAGIIFTFANFNAMIFTFNSQSYFAEKDLLAIGIGFILTYFSLALFITDRVNALLRQQNLADIFQQLDEIDEDFFNLNIVFNNNFIKYRLVAGIVIATFIESMIFSITFMLFVDKKSWAAWLWIYSCIPTYFNSLDKLWYIGILIAIRKRFEGLNNAIDVEALKLEQKRLKQEKLKIQRKLNKQAKKKYANNQIRPETKSSQAVFGDVVVNPPVHSLTFESNIYASPGDASAPTDGIRKTLEDKFVKYCQLHDTLCEVAKQLNHVYGFPALILMGYCFLIIIAELYFFYSANVNQEVPAIFQAAQKWWITAIYICYVSSKCVSILRGNWLTSLESRKTGICMHRCAMAADENDIYEMINHLSLKLFNHCCSFNACGYFALDMTTLFGFCGGITTYLIILIQFNLEEQQARINTGNGKPMAITQDNFTASDDVVNGTHGENTTSFLSLFH